MTKKEQPHRWRENIEALTMAVVIALLFKSFILEVSKIPSGSMQPTLMGSPETSIFDRVLVDKLSFPLPRPRALRDRRLQAPARALRASW